MNWAANTQTKYRGSHMLDKQQCARLTTAFDHECDVGMAFGYDRDRPTGNVMHGAISNLVWQK